MEEPILKNLAQVGERKTEKEPELKNLEQGERQKNKSNGEDRNESGCDS